MSVDVKVLQRGGFSLKEWIFTTDHKRVAVLYMIGSFAAFFVAGIMAMLMRTELASIGPTITSNPGNYNVWLYFHGAAMIVAYQIPALTGYFANYYVPIMIGAKDVAFPRLNALSVWLFWMGIILALLTFVIPNPPDLMWTGYPPYSTSLLSGNTAFYTFTVLLIGFSSIAGGGEFSHHHYQDEGPWDHLEQAESFHLVYNGFLYNPDDLCPCPWDSRDHAHP